jgi:hypothetical protein
MSRVHLAHQVLVGQQEGAKVHGVGVADDRHQEIASAVGALDVNGEAQPTCSRGARPAFPSSTASTNEEFIEGIAMRPFTMA